MGASWSSAQPFPVVPELSYAYCPFFNIILRKRLKGNSINRCVSAECEMETNEALAKLFSPSLDGRGGGGG